MLGRPLAPPPPTARLFVFAPPSCHPSCCNSGSLPNLESGFALLHVWWASLSRVRGCIPLSATRALMTSTPPSS